MFNDETEQASLVPGNCCRIGKAQPRTDSDDTLGYNCKTPKATGLGPIDKCFLFLAIPSTVDRSNTQV
jgi:hypothetical protein